MTKVEPSTTDTSDEPPASLSPLIEPRTGRTQLFYLPLARDKAAGSAAASALKRLPAEKPPETKTQIFGSDWRQASQTPSHEPPSSAPFQTTTEARRPLHVATGVTSSDLEQQPEEPALPPPLTQVTALHSIELLLSRRAALDALQQSRGAGSTPAEDALAAGSLASSAPEAEQSRPAKLAGPLGVAGLPARIARLSTVSKLSLLMLPLLGALLLAGSLVDKSRPAVAAARHTSTSAAVTPPTRPATVQQPSAPAVEAQRVEHQDGLQRRAADAVAEGRYEAALELYRQLSVREPSVDAYREAVRILETSTAPASR